jgi:hypothetical protein
MDLVPRRPEAGVFHANWTGWAYIAEVLELAGADTREMSGTNDGEYVHARTARSWGRAVRRILPRLMNKRVPDSLYSDGYREVPVLKPGDGAGTATDCTAGDLFPLDEETKEWLRRFADFCERSGGFWQY